MHRNARIGWKQLMLGTAALGLALSVAVDGPAWGQQDQAGTTIGQYSPQQVFQQAGYQQMMQQKMQEIQQQQQGGQQNRQQLMQKAQQARQQVLEKFQQDMKEVAPAIAQDAQVQALVQGEVQYTADSVDSKDVTDAVVSALQEKNPGANQGQSQPRQPRQPRQPQQN